MNIVCVVGARPNYMKMAPVFRALVNCNVRPRLVHTGQHYDDRMSKVFFDELGMPRPDVNLEVGSGSHARQTAKVMMAFEAVCLEEMPDLVLVGGDVNSTVAVAMVCSKLGIDVGHVESGLRSFDRSMPEEINRIVTDHISNFLFTTEESGNKNLEREGRPSESIHFVGNTMIDSLDQHLKSAIEREPWRSYGLTEEGYGLVTLHRPSNVDDESQLRKLMEAFQEISGTLRLVYPVHPRTQARLEESGFAETPGIELVPPLPYLDFLGLMARARCVLTDSGGIQEETTALGVPCLTIRENTERPVTISHGSNLLVGTDPERIIRGFLLVLNGGSVKRPRPPLWDGHAAERIAGVILS